MGFFNSVKPTENGSEFQSPPRHKRICECCAMYSVHRPWLSNDRKLAHEEATSNQHTEGSPTHDRELFQRAGISYDHFCVGVGGFLELCLNLFIDFAWWCMGCFSQVRPSVIASTLHKENNNQISVVYLQLYAVLHKVDGNLAFYSVSDLPSVLPSRTNIHLFLW